MRDEDSDFGEDAEEAAMLDAMTRDTPHVEPPESELIATYPNGTDMIVARFVTQNGKREQREKWHRPNDRERAMVLGSEDAKILRGGKLEGAAEGWSTGAKVAVALVVTGVVLGGGYYVAKRQGWIGDKDAEEDGEVIDVQPEA